MGAVFGRGYLVGARPGGSLANQRIVITMEPKIIAHFTESGKAHTTGAVLKSAQRARQAAFTLTELLIVVAIIAILAAILWPVGRRMIEQGNQAKCMSNLRQLYGVLMFYAAENNQMLPSPDVNADPDSPSSAHWFRRLDRYIAQQERIKILTCPSAKTFKPGAGARLLRTVATLDLTTIPK